MTNLSYMMNKTFNESNTNIIPSNKKYYVLDNVIVDTFTGLIYDTKAKDIIFECANEVFFYNNIPNLGIDNEICSNIIGNVDKEKNIELLKNKLREYFLQLLEKEGSVNNLTKIEDYLTIHLLSSMGEYMYGHVFDIFQKAMVLEKLHFNNYSLLCSNASQIVDFNKHLEALGFISDKHYYNDHLIKDVLYTESVKDRLVYIKKLLYIKPVSAYFSFTKESLEFIRRKYFEYFNVKNEEPIYKIFLNRNGVNIGRNANNYDELRDELLQRNIKIINGDEKLEQVVYLLSKATHVAGIHGSKFINSMFCPRVTKFREYCPDTKNSDRGLEFSIYKKQLKLSEDYELIRYASNSDRDNYTIDIQDLLNFYEV